jgi:hypothetical protein
VLAIPLSYLWSSGVSDVRDPTPVTLHLQPSPQTMLSSACRGISRQLVAAATRRSAVRSFSKSCTRSSDAIFVVSWPSFRVHPHKYTPSVWTAPGHRIQQPKGVQQIFGVCSDTSIIRPSTFRSLSSLPPTTSHGRMRSFLIIRPSTRKRPLFHCSTLRSDRTRGGRVSAS